MKYHLKELLAATQSAKDALASGIAISRFSSASAPPAGGARMLIYGRGFLVPAEGASFAVSVGSEPCPIVSVLSDTLIECIVPPGCGTQLKITVTSTVPVSYGVPPRMNLRFDMELTSKEKSGFSYDGPCIRRVDPVTLPTIGGRLTLFGANLGLGHPTVRIQNGISASIADARPDRLVLDIGPGHGERLLIIVQNDVGRSTTRFDFGGPEISHIDTLGVEAFPSKTRNQVFRINGYNFGPEGTPVRVLIDGQDTRCLGLLNEHTTLEARVPVGSGSRAIVQVVVGNRTSPVAHEHFIRYSPPRIFSCSRSGKPGDCFVVSGQNFGVGSSEVMVRIGGVACSGVSVLVPHTRLEATVPEGQGTNLPVAVIIGGQESAVEKDCDFSYKGAKPRAKGAPALPSPDTLMAAFTQAQLVKYYKQNLRQAELDFYGRPFTPASAEEALSTWKEYDKQMLRMPSKLERELLFRSILNAWRSFKVAQGIVAEESTRQNKKHRP